jgi:hypothetical protein
MRLVQPKSSNMELKPRHIAFVAAGSFAAVLGCGSENDPVLEPMSVDTRLAANVPSGTSASEAEDLTERSLVRQYQGKVEGWNVTTDCTIIPVPQDFEGSVKAEPGFTSYYLDCEITWTPPEDN